MPDLSYGNPAVEKAMMDVATFYLDMGIDGFRLDAAKWIYNEKENNIAFWERFRKHVEGINEEASLVGEIWDKAFNCKDYAAPLHSFFDFDIGEKTIDSINRGSASNILSKYIANYKMYKEQSETFVLAPFLTNHDQNRMMSILKEDDTKMKMAAIIYLTFPGTPFIWSSTNRRENTSWQPATNDIESIALENQLEDNISLYNFYKKLIHLRNGHRALSMGEVEAMEAHKAVFAMRRYIEKDEIFVIINVGDKVEEVMMVEGNYTVLLSNMEAYESQSKIDLKQDKIQMQPKEILIFEKE